MPKKSATHQKKVDAAVRILDTTTGVNVPQAMILAGFLKQDITNQTVRRMTRCHLKAKQTTTYQASHPPTISEEQTATNNLVLLPLTGREDNKLTTTTTRVLSGPTHPKPKRKQTRPTASAVQQRRIDNLAEKRHKSDVHKAAVRLYNAKKQKLDGMSIRQVQAVITEKYEVCRSIMTISRYAKQGLVNATPMKMVSVGPFFHGIQVFMQAYTRLIFINQMNACVRDDSRKKMIQMLSNLADHQ